MKLFLESHRFEYPISIHFSKGMKSATLECKEKFDDKTFTPLQLKEVSHQVDIFSNYVKQSSTLTFINVTDKVLEGELVFPLPESATICGFALEIDSVMCEASVVEKEKATISFEKDVKSHSKGDALVELVSGNNYKTKIYPLNPNVPKKVRLDFICHLDSDNSYNIPIEFKKHQSLEKVAVNVRVLASEKQPTTNSQVKPTQNEDGIYSFKFTETDLKSIETLKITTYPRESTEILLENDGERIFFNIKDFVNLKQTNQDETNISAVGILLDTSFSSRNTVDKQVEFITKFLEIQNKFMIKIFPFCNEVLESKEFSSENVDEVQKFISSIPRDGSTNLTKSITKIMNEELEFDFVLLISDGLENINNNLNIKFKSSSPIYSINFEKSSNMKYLEYVSQLTNGQAFDLSNFEEENYLKVIEKLVKNQTSFLKAEFDENEITEFYPSCSKNLIGEYFTCNGMLLKDSAKVTLHYGIGNKTLKSTTLELKKENARETNVLSVLWAKSCIDELSIFAEENKEQLLEIGRKYSLVTPNTSLLVLESFEQFLKHKITPPISRKDLYDRYMANIEMEKIREISSSQEKLKVVEKMWDQHLNWWNLWSPEEKAKKYEADGLNDERKRKRNLLESTRFQKSLSTTNFKVKDEHRQSSQKMTQETVQKIMKEEDDRKKSELEAARLKKIQAEIELQKMLEKEELEYRKAQEKYEEERRKFEEEEKIRKEKAEIAKQERIKLIQQKKEEKQRLLEQSKQEGSSTVQKPLKTIETSDDEIKFEVDSKFVPIDITDENYVVVLDTGSSNVKAGFGWDEEPRTLFPNVIGRPKQRSIMVGMGDKDCYIGDEALSKRGILQMKHGGSPSDAPSLIINKPPVAPSSVKLSNQSSTVLQPWNPTTPYLTYLQQFDDEHLYSQYIFQRQWYTASPAFYLDCSNYFIQRGLREYAIRILSNIIELDLESHQLLRIVGYKLDEFGELNESEIIFRKVLKLRPFEPQSYRDLALILEKVGKYDEAIKLFYKTIIGSWASQYSEIELTALIELNRLISIHNITKLPVDLPESFLKPTPLDLRIVMAWDTDSTDIDLHTIDPFGTEVYYGNKQSNCGGLNSKDFTQGYGPEWYMNRTADPGVYEIFAKYYSSHQQSLTGGTTILLTIFTDYGVKDKEKCQKVTVRLQASQEKLFVGSVEIK